MPPPHPTLIRIVRGFFNVPQNYQHSRNCETGSPAYRPYRRRLESLTICRWNYKGSTFLLSYLKTLSVGPVGVSNSRPPASQPGEQPNEPLVRGGRSLDTFSMVRWKTDTAIVTPYVRRLYWYRPWCALMVVYFLLSGVSWSWWYAWDKSILVKAWYEVLFHHWKFIYGHCVVSRNSQITIWLDNRHCRWGPFGMFHFLDDVLCHKFL